MMASLTKYDQPDLGAEFRCSVTRRSFLAVTAALIAPSVYGQNDVEDRRKSNARLEEMRRLAKEIKIYEITEGKAGPPLALRQDPLLHYTNPTPGGVLDGTLWGWGEPGRPPAVMKLGLAGPKRGERHWRFRVNVLSSKSIEVEFGDGVKWSSRQSGLEFRPLIDAPAPADSATLRLMQAREIGRRLTVSVLSRNGKNRTQFRFMPQPIARYSDPRAVSRTECFSVSPTRTTRRFSCSLRCGPRARKCAPGGTDSRIKPMARPLPSSMGNRSGASCPLAPNLIPSCPSSDG